MQLLVLVFHHHGVLTRVCFAPTTIPPLPFPFFVYSTRPFFESPVLGSSSTRNVVLPRLPGSVSLHLCCYCSVSAIVLPAYPCRRLPNRPHRRSTSRIAGATLAYDNNRTQNIDDVCGAKEMLALKTACW